MAHYEEAKARYAGLGQEADVANVELGIGLVEFERSDFASARDAFKSAAVTERDLAAETSLQAQCRLALAMARLGEFASADDAVAQALHVAEEQQYVDVQAHCFAVFAVIRAERLDLSGAQVAMDRSEGLYVQAGDRLAIADAYSDLAGAEVRRDESHRALDHYESAIRIYEEFSSFHKQAKTKRAMGEILEQANDPRSRQLLAEAADLFDASDCAEEAHTLRSKLSKL